jgi:Zn-dependent M28 family amino/carboxypeptidase
VTVDKNYSNNVLFNIIGVLPGKTKRNEFVIFSAHYDHIGSAKGKGDNIFNGANDDASGVAAVLTLAKYFSLRNDNERTIFFCAFAGEELGLYGSSYLASMLKPEPIKAVINIEMIGKTNVTGKNSFFVTGSGYSNIEKIFKANLKGGNIKIKSEPGRDLFQRSDNYPFALKGIPAHSIMCSDDYDPCYHKPCDEVKNIDIENMTMIIKAIEKASQSLINGKDTPSRVTAD